MATLFEDLARHRPEWLAQGLFIRAVQTEPAVLRLLQRAVDAPEGIPEVREEECTDFGWRADVVLRWRRSPRPIRCELKMAANFTRSQMGAPIDLLVMPQRARHAPPVPVLTWSQLAQSTKDEVLRELLNGVSASRTWILEQIAPDTVLADFAALTSQADQRSWNKTYRFLSTLNEHLTDLMGSSYSPSSRWTVAPRPKSGEPYYGWTFQTRGRKYWLGFFRNNGSIAFTAHPAPTGNALLMEKRRFGARRLAKVVARVVGS